MIGYAIGALLTFCFLAYSQGRHSSNEMDAWDVLFYIIASAGFPLTFLLLGLWTLAEKCYEFGARPPSR